MRAARWGRIISLSSVAAQIGGAVGPHYAASKGGVIGPIDTDMLADLPQLRPDLIPVGRFGTPEEIAEVAVMLACNGYLTGQTLNVNGGRYFG